MLFIKNKYRIITDNVAGYEAQVKYWWLPFFWTQINFNTNNTVQEAEMCIRSFRKKQKVIKIIK